MSTEGYVSVREAAERTGRSPALIRRWAREPGRLPGSVHVGYAWLIAEADLATIAAMPHRRRKDPPRPVKATTYPPDDAEFRKAVAAAVHLLISTADKAGAADIVREALAGRYPRVVIVPEPDADMGEFFSDDVRWSIFRDGEP